MAKTRDRGPVTGGCVLGPDPGLPGIHIDHCNYHPINVIRIKLLADKN